MQCKKIINATLLPLHHDLDLIENAEIVLQGDTIAALGRGPLDDKEYRGHKGYDEIIDARGQLVMPGLINTHTHAAMVLFRGYADDIPLMDWLESIWPLEERLTSEYVYWATLLASLEMLKSGTTTFCDMYFFMDSVARAVEKIGMRAVLSRGLVGLGEDGEEKLKEAKEFTQTWEGVRGRITTMLAPHAPYTCPAPFLKRVMALAQDLERPIHIHLSETRREVLDSKKEHGLSPIEWVDSLGLFTHPHVLAAHCVHIDEHDIDILAQRGVHVSSNPQSNLKLGSGVAPVKELLERGVNVSLGTDGAASNNNLNLWEEVRLASFLQKGLHEDASLLPAGEALLMATKRGAKALDLTEEIGSLYPGKQGDLIFIDLNRPHFFPRHNILSHLIYALGGGEITSVFVAGEEIIDQGRHISLDEEEIKQRTEVLARRLVDVE